MQLTPICLEKGHASDATGRCLQCGQVTSDPKTSNTSSNDVKSLRDCEDLKKILP